MKKNIGIIVIVAFLIAFGCPSSVFAQTTEHSTGAAKVTKEHSTSLRQEVAADRLRYLREKAAQNQGSVTPFNFGDGAWGVTEKQLKINLIMQERRNYCGPACMKMAYNFITGFSGPTQTYYARWLGIDNPNNSGDIPGTFSEDIKNIWKKLHSGVYIYHLGQLLPGEDDSWLQCDIQQNMYENIPLFFSVDTASLDAYDYSCYHFILIGGYKENDNDPEQTVLTYYDPNYASPGPAKLYDTYANAKAALLGNAGFYLY